MFTPVAKVYAHEGIHIERLLPENLAFRVGQQVELVFQYDFRETKDKQILDLYFAASFAGQEPAPVRFTKKDNWGINDDAFGALKILLDLPEEGDFTLQVNANAVLTSGPWGEAPTTSQDLRETYTTKVNVGPTLEAPTQLEQLES